MFGTLVFLRAKEWGRDVNPSYARMKILLSLFSAIPFAVAQYTWKNVKIGGGGGFVPGIVFNPSEEGE